MYTKIDTNECLKHVSEFLLRPSIPEKFTHYPPKTLVEAPTFVMKNYRMEFGDILVKQLTGIAMEMSPAPAIANLFVAIFETEILLPIFEKCLPLNLRCIDDGLAVWETQQ